MQTNRTMGWKIIGDCLYFRWDHKGRLFRGGNIASKTRRMRRNKAGSVGVIVFQA